MNKQFDYINGIPGAMRRFLDNPVEIEMRDDQSKRPSARGIAAVYNSTTDIGGWFQETIMPGAFDGRLDDDVRALLNHNRDILFARTKAGNLFLNDGESGLGYAFDIPDTENGRDLQFQLESKNITQSSFAFIPDFDSDEWIRTGDDLHRKIHKVRQLLDVSPVTYPAYNDTKVDLKHAAHIPAEVKEVLEFHMRRENEQRTGNGRWKESHVKTWLGFIK